MRVFEVIRFILTFIFSALIVLFFTQNSLVYYLEQRFHTSFGLENILNGSIFSRGGAIFSAFSSFIETSTKIIKGQEILENSENSKMEFSENSKLENSEQNITKFSFADNNITAEILISPKLEKNTTNSEIGVFKIDENLQTNIANEQNFTNNFTQNFTDLEQNKTNKLDKNITKFKAEIKLEPHIKQDFKPEISYSEHNSSGKIHLKSGDSVLFIGDSLMQYVGLNARKIMPKVNLKVIDLSKQSTGLIDRKGHNWHSELKNALNQNEKIKLVVVLLGANDPWGQHIDGKARDIWSQQWQDFYSARVRGIYEIAKKHGTKVLWLSMPCMKKPDFEKKTALLNSIYWAVNAEYKQFYFNTSAFICDNGEYQTHVNNGKKLIKARQDDGIHMSNAGSAIIADEILKRIEIE